MKLRSYQRDQVLAISRELATHDSTLVVSATGTGKTVVMAFASEVHLRQGGRRVLILAPRDELISQAKKTLLRAIPRLRSIDIAVEKAEQRAAAGADFVLASPQSLHPGRLELFDPGEFSLVIVDEAHLGGELYQGILDYWDDAKRIGFTATPDRLDGRPLAPYPYESIAHVYELPHAIADGYLSPLSFRRERLDDLDLSSVRLGADGDLNEADLERESLRLEVLVSAAVAIRGAIEEGRRKTLAFCVSVRHAIALSEVLKTLGVAADYMDGSASAWDRRRVMDSFRSGETSVLCNCLLYTYGLDVPDIDCVVLARPTKSRALYSQMVGRGSRLAAGKEDCLVIDLVGNVGQHTLVTPEDALFTGALVGEGGRLHPLATVSTPGHAAELAAQETLEEIDTTSTAILASRLKTTAELIDPDLAIFGIEIPVREETDRNATPAQVDALERAGVEAASLLSFDQAQALFEELNARWGQGLCTLRQGRLLARRGLNPNAPMDRATWAIDKIKENRWKTPPEVVADPKLKYGGGVPLRVRTP